MDNIRIGLENRDKRGPEVRILLGKLECQRGEDELEITAILDTPRTKERSPKAAISKGPFCDRLCDRGFSCPGESVKPEDGDPSESSVQRSISSSTPSRVPFRQPTRLPCRYSAPWARRQPFKTARWATKRVSPDGQLRSKKSDLVSVEPLDTFSSEHPSDLQSVRDSAYVWPLAVSSRRVALMMSHSSSFEMAPTW